MLKLKNSGYGRQFRKEILDSALKAYDRMLADDKNGTKPLYRSKNWNFEERQKAKLNKGQNWWNKEESKIQYNFRVRRWGSSLPGLRTQDPPQ